MQWGPPDEDGPSDAGSDEGQASGWVPPEARSWRHPSELHAAAFAAVFSVPRHRWRRRGAVVGAAALVAVLVGTVLLVQTGSTPTQADDDTMTVSTAAVTACCRLPAAVAQGVEQAIVSIGTTGGGGALGCGVIVGEGLVATTSEALAGLRRVRVLAITGRAAAGTVMAVDPPSGIVLLRLSKELAPGAPQVASVLQPGAAAVAVAMRTGQGARPAALWASGKVVSVGVPGPGSPAGGMAAITLEAPTVPAMPGEALVDPQGRVEGVLVGWRGAERTFLPMAVVVGVSHELEAIGRVRHGWLDVTDETAPGHSGAVVVSVDPKGAAAGHLRAGDVIVRVDGASVASSAALRSMLYVLSPGTPVRLDAVRGSQMVHAVVRLAASP